MARYATWVVLVALLSSTGAAAAPLCEQQRVDGKKPEASASQPEGPPRWKWWLHADSRKELRLTDQQSRKIDEVWESYAPRQRERGQELEKLRAEYNATRTVMIYRMHLLLTPEQRVKVDEMRARMEAERRKRQEQEEERKRQGRGGEKD